MGFKLVRVDSAEPYKVNLRLGSHLIGRGKLLDCNDNRVSRNHAELIVTSDSILLKSLHQNPCFVKKKASDDTVIFSQPDSQVLTNGDQFGLIPEHYWYEVIQMSADTSSPSTDSQEMNTQAVNVGLNQDFTRNDSNTQSYVPEPPDDDQNCSQSVLDEVFDAPFDLPQENQASSSTQIQNVLNKPDSIEHMDISSSERQTESNELARTPVQTDRLQSENEPSTPNQSIATNVEMDQHESNNNHGHTASNKMSYEDEDVDPVHQTAMSEDTEHTPNKSPSKRLHSEDESPLDAKRIKTEPDSPSKDDKNNVLNEASCSNQGIKQEPDSPQDAKPGPSNIQGPSNTGPNNAPNMPPSPTKPVNNLPRERCWYGANCYSVRNQPTRSPRRVSMAQLEILWKFLNSHKDIALAYNKSTEARHHSKVQWHKVARILNKQADGFKKTSRAWNSYWVDYKSKLKKLVVTKAGGGGRPYTEFEKKFLALLGEDFGSGVVAKVEPFSSESNSTEEHTEIPAGDSQGCLMFQPSLPDPLSTPSPSSTPSPLSTPSPSPPPPKSLSRDKAHTHQPHCGVKSTESDLQALLRASDKRETIYEARNTILDQKLDKICTSIKEHSNGVKKELRALTAAINSLNETIKSRQGTFL